MNPRYAGKPSNRTEPTIPRLDPSSTATEPYALYWAATTPHPVTPEYTHVAPNLAVEELSRYATLTLGGAGSMLVLRGKTIKVLFFSLQASPENMPEEYFRRLVEIPLHRASESPSETSAGQAFEAGVTYTQEFLDAFADTLDRIGRLANLKDNWDSDGASPVDRRATRAAAELLSLMHRLAEKIPQPIVGPTPSGGVDLQWHTPTAEMYVEVGSESCDYYVADLRGRVREDGGMPLDQLPQLASHLVKLLK